MKKIILCFFIALGINLLTVPLFSFVAKTYPTIFGAKRSGLWVYSSATGNKNASPYLKAYVNIMGLLALNKSETIYFVAKKDQNGEDLNVKNTYYISGEDNFHCRWWSITAYQNNYLIKNKENIYSLSQTTINKDKNNFFSAEVSPSNTKISENWLPTGNKDGSFDLLLRCYNPSPDLIASIQNGTIKLPLIRKIK